MFLEVAIKESLEVIQKFASARTLRPRGGSPGSRISRPYHLPGGAWGPQHGHLGSVSPVSPVSPHEYCYHCHTCYWSYVNPNLAIEKRLHLVDLGHLNSWYHQVLAHTWQQKVQPPWLKNLYIYVEKQYGIPQNITKWPNWFRAWITVGLTTFILVDDMFCRSRTRPNPARKVVSWWQYTCGQHRFVFSVQHIEHAVLQHAKPWFSHRCQGWEDLERWKLLSRGFHR